MPKVPRLNGVENNKIAPQLMAMAVDIDSVSLDPDNARVHPDENMQAIKHSLTKFGQVIPITCREATRVIIAGNGRWKAAKELGWTKIAANFVSLDHLGATSLGLVDNRTSELARWDMKIVDRLQELLLDAGEPIIGWDDDYVESIARMPDWNPTAQDQSEEAQRARETTISIKMTAHQRELLEGCIQMIKSRRSSPKKMTDAEALMLLIDEWASV